MKSFPRSLLLVVALTISMCAQAQTFEQSLAAAQSGDYRKAFEGFKKLAEKGNAVAQYNLGVMYANGEGVPKDAQKAVVWLRKSAEQGFAMAQGKLGIMYSMGEGVPEDAQQAVVWYRKAAEQGVPSAQAILGSMYDNGKGVPKDSQQAAVWYGKAAEQGDELAQYSLGLKYANGDGVPKDSQQAVVWYRKSAEQGVASAQINLGNMYLRGDGVPKDARQAVVWYRKAAEQGVAAGQLKLGYQYFLGDGVPKDAQQAANWYSKAAEQGDVLAQYGLGLMYIQGEGVSRDLQISYFWALLASAQGYQMAAKLRDDLERVLSPDQRASAQATARNWRPKAAAQSSSTPGGGFAYAGGPAPASAQADSTGSGIRIARDAIVTNHHVIAGCSRLHVNGTAAQVRGSDARSDLALLGVTLSGSSVKLRAQRVAVGEAVAVAGYPLRGMLSGLNMTTGTISSLSGLGGDTRYLQITAPVQPGNSGGPMLDSAGNLMGVVVSKLDAIKMAKITGDIPQNVNFAIHANVLRSFLDANSVEYDSANSDKPIAPTAIAEKAKGFTVLVECWK